MRFARFSVERPVFTVMSTLSVVILGFISLSRLPVDLMPDISFPTLSISTSYENAGPEEIEEMITRPIERAMSAVPGVEEVASVSSEGSSRVTLSFAWGTDLDAAANDVRDRLDRAIAALPDEATRPALRKFDPSAFPILILGAASDLDPVQMRRLIDDEVRYRVERVPGVAALDIWGGHTREIQVELDADKLKLLNISPARIVNMVRAANVVLPAGSIEDGSYDITIRTLGEYTSLDQLRETIIAVRNGAVVRLRDVAEVRDGWERVRRIVRVDGRPGVRLSINKQSGANTVDVAERVLAEIARINEDIPQLRITPIIDTSRYIQRSITNVGSAALYGGLFAIIVLLVFLRNIRSTLVISISIPVSIIATFAMIYFGGFTLNIMTLGGLALGVGMLVDNAIVVLENIYRMREDGVSVRQAAVSGADEVTSAITASTMTTLAIFLPLIFVRGMAGVMFKQLAFVVGFALLCSLGVALTLIPMLASRVLRGPGENPDTGLMARLFSISGDFFRKLEADYKKLLHFALEHRLLVVLLGVILFSGSLALMPLIGTELTPQSDEGEVRVNLEMDVGTRVGALDEIMRQAEKIVCDEVPEMESMVTSLGGSWRGTSSHTGNMRISLKSRSVRRRSSEEIAAALRPKLADLPGVVIRTRAGQGMFLMRRMGGGAERVEVEIRGYDLETAGFLAARVKDIIEAVPGVTDAQITRDVGAPERVIHVDRSKAEAMNVAVRDVAEILQTILSGSRAGYYRDAGQEYLIRVRVRDAETLSLRDVLDLTVPNADGKQIVLRNVVSVVPQVGPVQIERKNQERIIPVRANIEGRDIGSIMDDIRVGLETLPVPRGFTIGFGGDYEEQQETFRELAVALTLALVLIYMVMACLYESLRDPFVVMFSVPLAVIGVVLMLFLTDTTFNMQSYIGCIMLTGIVVNNAILLVDYTNLLRREGMNMRAAIEEAGRRRLRPILMTALTTICGLIPLALGLGEGGEAQAPMARAVIGGLLSSTFITLVIVPVIYSFIGQKEIVVSTKT